MGWASRARVAGEQRESHRYRVRRWTAFDWPEGTNKRDTERRTARERALVRAGELFERKLRKLAPDLDAVVKQVRIKGAPQLMFELTVVSVSKEAAKAKARYYIGRGLTARVPTRSGGVLLVPPWGRMEASEVRDRRTLRVAEPVAD